MSGILDNVLGTILKDEVTKGMSNQLGLDNDKAKSALGSAVPILLQALSRNASNTSGEQALESALRKDHDGSILNNISGYLSNPKQDEGSKILNHILGNKRSNVEKYVSNDSGLSSDMVGKLLSTAAPIIMGALGGKQSNNNSGIGSLLSGMTNEIKGSASKEQTIIEQLLDQDNDGSIVDDVASMGMSFLGKMFKK